MHARLILAAVLSLIAGAAAAGDRVVYKNVDASGSVSYSDRRSDAQDARMRNWMPGPSSYDYAGGVQRAAEDRTYYARQQYERRLPPPIAVYDPRRWQAQRERVAARTNYSYAGYARSYSGSGRRDFNLPDSPAPSVERNYYYNGR